MNATYYVFTHYDLPGLEVEAESKNEALAKGVETRNGAMIPGGYKGCEVAGSDGPLWIPAKPAKPLEEPYACKKPKNTRRRW